MAKASPFTLDPNPKFKLDVKIPKAGSAEPGVLTVHFKHRPIDEFVVEMQAAENRLAEVKEGADEGFDIMVDHLMSFCEGWGFPEAFTAENVRRLCVNYPRAFSVINADYYLELMGLRSKN